MAMILSGESAGWDFCALDATVGPAGGRPRAPIVRRAAALTAADRDRCGWFQLPRRSRHQEAVMTATMSPPGGVAVTATAPLEGLHGGKVPSSHPPTWWA